MLLALLVTITGRRDFVRVCRVQRAAPAARFVGFSEALKTIRAGEVLVVDEAAEFVTRVRNVRVLFEVLLSIKVYHRGFFISFLNGALFSQFESYTAFRHIGIQVSDQPRSEET